MKNWLTFKVDKLQFNQLYFWYATKFDWIPLWATENEFLLLNFNKIKYEKVNFTQFTKASWIAKNSVKPEDVKRLLHRFQIPTNVVDQMQPIINSIIQDGQVAATGQPYFINYYDQTRNQIGFYNNHRYGWNLNRWFNKNDNRYNFQFVKEFKQVFHYNRNPTNATQVKSLREAMDNAPNGTYIYHEKDTYIPYRVNHSHVTFNRGDAMEIKTIRNQLNQNRNINTNAYNKLNYKQYQLLYEVRQSIFIDLKNVTYRIEFMVNYSQTIPKVNWHNKTFDDLFNNANSLSTFMLLDHTGIYGVPIGINKYSKSIILNNNAWLKWNDFKTRFNENEIERYQNLDFKGNENLLDNQSINNNYKIPCQQIAKVDLEKLSKATILSYFIGQYVLIDYNGDSYLPIYIYTTTLIRTNQHIVNLADIVRYVDQIPNALIHKDEIENSENYVTITPTNCAIKADWKSSVVNQAPDLDIIQVSNINGQMTEEQAEMVDAAMNNANNHVSDRQQFRKNGNKDKNGKNKNSKSRSQNNSPILQPQQLQQQDGIQIIPLLNVSQLPINQPKPVEADKFVDIDELKPPRASVFIK